MSSYDEATAGKLSGIKTEILVAWIFALLAVIGFAIGFLFYFLYFFIFLGIFGGYYSYLYLIPGLIVGIPFLILMIMTIFVLRRTGQMRTAANRGDIARLKGLNSVGWAIVALIFAGVIPGIMLLIAHGPIEELQKGGAGGGMQPDAMERITKLKSLLDSGAITKEEYESQKNSILHPGRAQASTSEDELKKLKTLFDSGAISAAEYEDQRKKILGRM